MHEHEDGQSKQTRPTGEGHGDAAAGHEHTPHLRAHPGPDVCERCGANEHVHDRLCRRCRRLLLGEGTIVAPARPAAPHSAPGAGPAPHRRGA